ncbi:hypothetical protein [Methylocucumis oryzae]|uniref:Uncharacterized protein n=1 Tax=Methylocucumis oryzae TaxID=1632867 RepID=A0A0F3IJL8_9GAMM|nr:hypothetical protein [Methylocucumis oryzae]KJV06867.1 hypothetical protein VZ94_08460 [Methylocucumis oryzae]
MTHTAIAKAREFHHRFLKLSDTSGYDWVFNVLTLMQEYLPSDDVSIDVVRPVNNHPETIEARLPVLGILNEKNQYALDLFLQLVSKNSVC